MLPMELSITTRMSTLPLVGVVVGPTFPGALHLGPPSGTQMSGQGLMSSLILKSV